MAERASKNALCVPVRVCCLAKIVSVLVIRGLVSIWLLEKLDLCPYYSYFFIVIIIIIIIITVIIIYCFYYYLDRQTSVLYETAACDDSFPRYFKENTPIFSQLHATETKHEAKTTAYRGTL